MATTNSADGDTKTTDSDIDISTATLAKQNHQYIDMFTFHILHNIFISLNNFSSMYYQTYLGVSLYTVLTAKID